MMMRAEGQWLPLVFLVCALVVNTGESHIYRRFRVSRTSRPFRTHPVTTTTDKREGNPPPHYHNTDNYHHRLDSPLTTARRHHNVYPNHLFTTTINNKNQQLRNYHDNSTRAMTSGNSNLSNTNHYHGFHEKHYGNHRDHLTNSEKHHRNHQQQQHNHHGNADTSRKDIRYSHHQNKKHKHKKSHRMRGRGQSKHPHNHKHQRRLSTKTTYPKQTVKRHLGGTRGHLQHPIRFLQPMRLHTSFRSAFSNGLSYHRIPQLWDIGRLRNHHQKIMHHLSSRLRDHMMKMRSHTFPQLATTHYRSYRHNHRPPHLQGSRRDHTSHHNRGRVHCHNGQPRHPDTKLDDTVRTPGTKFKIPRGDIGGIPEDVEVFRWPKVVPSHSRPTTTTTTATTTTTTTTPRPITVDNNPSLHNAGSPYGQPNNPSPTTPTFPDPFNHDPIFSALFPSQSPSITPEWKGHGASESGSSHVTTINVQDHLHQEGHSASTPTSTSALPCIKCPPDTRVYAPRGRDCVYAQTPSPLPCTPQLHPDVQTIVTEGPTPGTRLQEGHYAMSFTVVVMEGSHGATPIANCRVGYDVEVRKCDELPRRAGLEVLCSAGRAWGSRCTWRCLGNLQLRGASTTTCSGHSHPRWSHEPPSCVAPSPPTTPPLPVISKCYAPPDVPGGQYFCTPPDGRPVNIPIPKDDPSVQRNTRNISPTHHLEGSVCELHCESGRIVPLSKRGRQRLMCTSGGHWDHRPPPCHLQVTPTLQNGDCKDITLRPPHSPLSFLPLPNFRTSSGVAARVTCVLETRSEGLHTRTCTGEDPELETKTHCKYRITILDLAPDPDAVLTPGLTENKGAGYDSGDKAGRGTSTEDEWDEERKYHDKENDESTGYKPEIYDEQDDDYDDYDEDEADEIDYYYYYDGKDYDEGETIPELQRDEGHTLGSRRRDRTTINSHGRKKRRKHKNSAGTRNSRTSPRHSKTTRRKHRGIINKTSSSPPLPLSSPSSPPSSSLSTTSSTRIITEIAVGGKDLRAEPLETISNVSKTIPETNFLHRNSNQRQDEEEINHHNYRRGHRTKISDLKEYTIQTKENGVLTREGDWSNGPLYPYSSTPPAKGQHKGRITGDGSIPATMEAVMKMEVMLGSCTVAREVARLLGKALTNQERCSSSLTCHNPRHTCKEDSTTGGHGRVELVWAVGGVYESQEDDTANPHHVPEVETAISAILESTRKILTSQRLASSLAAFGAAMDPDSFLVTNLDLVCRQTGLKLHPENNRCWPK